MLAKRFLLVLESRVASLGHLRREMQPVPGGSSEQNRTGSRVSCARRTWSKPADHAQLSHLFSPSNRAASSRAAWRQLAIERPPGAKNGISKERIFARLQLSQALKHEHNTTMAQARVPLLAVLVAAAAAAVAAVQLPRLPAVAQGGGQAPGRPPPCEDRRGWVDPVHGSATCGD